jgi:cytochrome c553
LWDLCAFVVKCFLPEFPMSEPAVSAPRFCLRDLPIPAKLVITCFLLAVGVGYFSALVQLHFQDSKSGQPMPTVADVVLKFTGKKWMTEPPPPPVSTFVRLITAPEEGLPFNGSGTMSPAFFAKCPEFTQGARGGDQPRTQLRADLTGERDVLVLWANAPAAARLKAYQDDHFGVAAADMPKAVTPKFKSAPDAVKVKSIIDARCVLCHGKGGDAEQYPLDRYEAVEQYLIVDPAKPFPAGGDWVRVQEPMSLTKLTQSTHAHLLSFAVLFSLTGLTFAFTSYPTSVRCIIAPLAVVAIVTDVAFWWLARLSDGYGVYFAKGVIGTGGTAGLALGAQIALSVWNMYGSKGKLVLVLLFALGGGTGGLVAFGVVKPALEEKQRQIQQAQQTKAKSDNTHPPVTLVTKLSRLEEVLQFTKGPDGKDLPVLTMPFKNDPERNMVRALFDKDGNDGEFAAAVKAKDQAAIDKLTPQRHGERFAFLAWSRLPDAERKKTFDDDAFDLPPEAKQATPDYVNKNGKFKIASLVTDRCVRCHGNDVKIENKFENYETLKTFLVPKAAAN